MSSLPDGHKVFVSMGGSNWNHRYRCSSSEDSCCSVRAGPEWTNYDAQSYAKNFDNGGWADSYFDEEDEDEKLGLRETALHTALLQKLYSKRGYKSSSTAATGAAFATALPAHTASSSTASTWVLQP